MSARDDIGTYVGRERSKWKLIRTSHRPAIAFSRPLFEARPMPMRFIPDVCNGDDAAQSSRAAA
jgi:hypothetical protein